MKIGNDDDPIQENNPIRFGMENLTEEEKSYSLEDAYNDLHECSDDLSDEGSKKEEIEHARYAEQVRILKDNNKSDATSGIQYNVNKNTKNVMIFLVVICFVIPMMVELLGIFGTIVSSIISQNKNAENNYTYEDTYEDTYDNEPVHYDYEKQEQLAELEFENLKSNINIVSTRIETGDMILELTNSNSNNLTALSLQTIFYNEEDKPIYIDSTSINNLYANGRYIYDMHKVPEKYERYEFLLTKMYDYEDDTNYTDVTMEVDDSNADTFEISLTNNTDAELSWVNIAILYYKDGKIVEYDDQHIFDIKPDKTKKEEVYRESFTEYDDVEFIINEIQK